jgi:hypothetical protein
MEKAHERNTMGKNNQREEEPERARPPRRASLVENESSADPQPPTEHPAVAAYRAAFGQSPTKCQATAIAEAVADLSRWARVLDDWQANAWRAESVGKMLDRYHHAEEERPAPSAHRAAPADRRPGRLSAAPTPEELARFLNRPRPGAGQHVA